MRTAKAKRAKKSSPLNEELREANDHQLKLYLQGYDQFWRLHKLYCLRFLLESREALRGVVKEQYSDQNFDDEKVVYSNITNGILADAISELVMLCEDYLSFLRFIREPLRFVKKALAYSAGSVTSIPAKLRKPDAEMLRKLFFIPSDDLCVAFFSRHNLASAHTNAMTLRAQLKSLSDIHESTIKFYDAHSDFHVQYKHGLKLALNGLNGGINQNELIRRRVEFSAPLFAFESKPVSSLGYGSAMMIPDVSFESMRKNLGVLHEDLNLLHIQLLQNVDIDECIGVGRSVVLLIHLLIENRLSMIRNKGTGRIHFSVAPEDGGALQCHFYELGAPPGYPVPTLLDFQID